jgi:hypothetical protein
MKARGTTTDNHKEFLEKRGEALAESKAKAHELIDAFEGTFVLIGLNYDKKLKVTGASKMAALIGEPSDVIAIGDELHEASHAIIEDVIHDLPESSKLSVLMSMVAAKLKRSK